MGLVFVMMAQNAVEVQIHETTDENLLVPKAHYIKFPKCSQHWANSGVSCTATIICNVTKDKDINRIYAYLLCVLRFQFYKTNFSFAI